MSRMNKCKDDREYQMIAIKYKIKWKISWVTTTNIKYSDWIWNIKCDIMNDEDDIKYE